MIIKMIDDHLHNRIRSMKTINYEIVTFLMTLIYARDLT